MALKPASTSIKWLFIFSFINTILLSLLSLRFWAVIITPTHALTYSFIVIATIGHAALFSFGGIIMPLLLSLLGVKTNLIKLLAVLLGASLFTIILVDTFCYQQYRFHINYAILELFFGPASREVFVFSTTMYLKIFASISIVFLVYGLLSVFTNFLAKTLPGKYIIIASGLVLGLIVVSNISYAAADVASYTPITQYADPLPYFPRITARKTFAKFGIKTTSPRINTESSDGSLLYPTETLRCSPNKQLPNILFLVIDAWRFDMLQAAETPNIHGLLPQSLNFTDHSSGGSATRSGIFSLFYALPARYWHPILAERQPPVFMTKLQELNYQFGIYASAPLSSPEFDRTVFSNINLPPANRGKTVADRDIEIKDRFVSFLKERDKTKPFFGFVFFDDPHTFILPDGFTKKFFPSLDEPDFMALNQDYDPVPFLNLYRNTLLFDDQLIGEILSTMKNEKLMDDTIIIVTGDHGQEFNEHKQNYWGHNGNFSKLQVNVPLVIRWPGKQPGTLTHWTSHVDIVPTLLSEISGCNNDPTTYSVGRSLFDSSERSFLVLGNYAKTAIIEPTRITTLDPYGPLQITDQNLNPLDTPPPADLINFALEQQRRFFKK